MVVCEQFIFTAAKIDGDEGYQVIAKSKASDANQSFFRSYEKFNSISFVDYLKKAQKKFGKIFVIVDRASQHTSNDTKRYLKNNKNVKLAYLPRGSPHIRV